MAVCDMTKFPNIKYFQQHEVPEYGPEDFQYDFTRLLIIRAEAAVEKPDEVSKLVALNMIMEEFEDSGHPGIARTKKDWWAILTEFHGLASAVGSRTAVPGSKTPFDFTLWNKSRIIIVLKGDFWKFSSQLAAVTTKHQYGSQYFDLRRHVEDKGQLMNIPEAEWEHRFLGTNCKCVSFFSQEPCLPQLNATHGFSLNIDLCMEMKLPGGVTVPATLPITIDPDVENKGGNPGP